MLKLNNWIKYYIIIIDNADIINALSVDIDYGTFNCHIDIS